MRKLIIGAALCSVSAFAQGLSPANSGGNGCTGSATTGYVATATSSGTNPSCTWQAVGSASVTETAISNSEFVTAAGTANAITGTTTTTYAAYVSGYAVRLLATANNTGATTIALNGIATPAAITKNGTTALTGGEIQSGHVYLLVYDGTEFQLVASGQPAGAAGGDLAGTYPNPTVAKINGALLSGLATGILKNTTGTGVPTIAVSGTDYAPPTSGTAILKGNGTGGFSNAVPGTDYLASLPATVVQTNQSNTYTTGTQSFASAAHVIAKNGLSSAIPGTCTVGEVYFATDATAGQNWFFCTAPSTWTQQLNSGGGGGGAALPGVVATFNTASGTCSTSGGTGTNSCTAANVSGVGTVTITHNLSTANPLVAVYIGSVGSNPNITVNSSGQLTLTFTGDYTGTAVVSTGGAASGTVTSVGMSVPSWLSVAGSPITSNGTLAVSAATGQTQNQVLATPNGSTGSVSLRPLVAPDIPNIAESQVTNLTTDLASKVPATRNVNTTAPLTGGGALSADLTLNINNFTGDSGSGGAKGAVPAPAAGDAAAGKYLKSDGTWAVPPGSTGVNSVIATFNTSAGTCTTTGGTGSNSCTATSGSVVITHNLSTSDPLVSVYIGSAGANAGITVNSSSQLTLTFVGNATGTANVSTGGIGATGPSGSSAALPSLINDSTNLLALYDFTDASGTSVTCQQGSACATMTINNPGNNGSAWTKVGYTIPSGSTTYLSVAASLIASAKTVVVVTDATNGAVGTGTYKTLLSCNSWDFLIDQGNNNIRVYNTGSDTFTNRQTVGGGNTNVSMGASAALSWIRGLNSTTDLLMVNGHEPLAYTSQGNTNSLAPSGSCRIGNDAVNGFGPIQGTIRLMAFFSDAQDGHSHGITFGEIKQIEHAKAIAAGNESRDLLVISGNSIDGGHSVALATAEDIQTAVSTLLSYNNLENGTSTAHGPNSPKGTMSPNIRVYNSAVQGQTTVNMLATDSAYHNGDNAGSGNIPVYAPANMYRVEVLNHYVFGWEGTNYIATGATASQQETAYSNWSNSMADLGYMVYGATTPTFGSAQSNATMRGYLDTANHDVRANFATTYGMVGYADLAADPHLMDPGNVTYSCSLDGTHFVPTCMRSYVAPIIMSALGPDARGGMTKAAIQTGTTGSLGGSALGAGACSSTTITMPGATTNMRATATPATYPGDGAYWRAYVSANDTVTVKVCQSVAGTPTASVYNVSLDMN